jgi:MoxR-like ATPase
MEELKPNTGGISSYPVAGNSTYSTDIRALNEMIQQESAFVDLLKMEMDKVIVGQKYMVERLPIWYSLTSLKAIPRPLKAEWYSPEKR